MGDPLDFTFKVQDVSGFVVPLSGELKIEASGLNYSDTKTVTINPIGENIFSYSIPLPTDIAAGTYNLRARFSLNNSMVYSGSYAIQIPAPGMRLSEPPPTIAAGAALPLDFVNDGGKDGSYVLELTLNDKQGKVMLTHADTQAIAAGGTYHLDLTVPDGLKSGQYIFKQAVNETSSGKSFALQSEFTVNGLEATLNSYTLKEKYFDNETVAGKAEITNGSQAIAAGKLRAKIVKVNRSGITVFKPGESYLQAAVEDCKSFGNKDYFLVSGKGLVEFDRVSGKYTKVIENEDGYKLFISANGELWFSTWDEGIWHRNTSGQWLNYTTANGLLNNQVWDYIESDQGAIWMATEAGISVFNNGTWSSYTTANGLSSDNVFQFAKDNEGKIWAWSEGGIDRFNGSGFDKMDTPFDPANVSDMKSSATGDIWVMSYIYDADLNTYTSHIWRYAQGGWTELNTSAISPAI